MDTPAYCDLFHPRGVRVRMPLPAEPELCLAALEHCLSVGWLTMPPGTEIGTAAAPGEERHSVMYVVKTFTGKKGDVPTVDLYSTKGNELKPFFRRYLDAGADAAEFERASGLVLENLPVYVGDGRLERGKNPQTDKLIVQAPKPFPVILKPNPAYNPAETDVSKKKPKYLFVRFPDAAPATVPPTPAKEKGPPTPAVEMHLKLIQGCATANELEMAKQLANADKFITAEDRDDLIIVIGAQLSKIQGDNPTEAQQAEYVELLSRFGTLENGQQLNKLGDDCKKALAEKRITKAHADDLRGHWVKADKHFNPPQSKKGK